ncbi:LysR family transcriptional regulator [Comamonas sp. Tr-654]|nr:LysR substrate-binding domain-containing protein [Comamonas sp. Tr-654]NIF82683.1 LysR family transcriptional regulator [Comamonas sp. Tr-654]
MSAPVFLNALRAFEASARHQSFSAAGKELNVSSAAVGQLVRSLEDWLEVQLFTRTVSGRQRIVPTDAALAALPDIRAGFDRLSVGMAKLKESASQNTLTLTVSPAFASKWLLPRIESFSAQDPDTDLLLDTNQRFVDFVAQRIDIGVRYGAGIWPGLASEKLMEEAVFPVCSPDMYKQLDIREPSDLLMHTLIHDMTGDSNSGYVTWETWFNHVGVLKAPLNRGHRINNSAAVLQAAVNGQGIALARSVMACDDVKSGRLIRLLPDVTVLSPLSYYAVYREECISKPRLKSFLAWLKDEASRDCPTSETKIQKRAEAAAKRVSRRESASSSVERIGHL